MLLFICSFGHEPKVNSNFETYIRNISCKNQLVQKLSRDLKKRFWMPIAVSVANKPLTKGIQFYDSTEEKLHQLYISENQTFYVEKNFQKKIITKKIFNEKLYCKMDSKKSDLSIVEPEGNSFSDIDLHKTIRQHEWGVFYFWTPAMPLSIEGISEIKKAMNKIKGHLVILADPKAEALEIQNLISTKKISSADARRFTSNQLLLLDIKMHYPGILVFKNGKISNRSYLGFKKMEMYEKFLKLELAQIERGVF